MESAAGNNIPNEQSDEISVMERNWFAKFDSDYPKCIGVCQVAVFRYNCHGLTFGARRTSIIDNDTIKQIISDDGYMQVSESDVQPGDVILYFDETGDCEHSGLVIEAPTQSNLRVSKVRSKWGKYKEVIHPWNHCPYNFSDVKYYRVQS